MICFLISSVIKCKIPYKDRQIYLFYLVASQLMCGISTQIFLFLHHTIRPLQLQTHNWTHKLDKHI